MLFLHVASLDERAGFLSMRLFFFFSFHVWYLTFVFCIVEYAGLLSKLRSMVFFLKFNLYNEQEKSYKAYVWILFRLLRGSNLLTIVD